MRIGAIDSLKVIEDSRFNGIRLEQFSSAKSAIIFLSVLLPATALLLSPIAVLSHLAIVDLEFQRALLAKPVSASLVLLGMIAWAILWVIPAWRYMRKIAVRRVVLMEGGHVEVEDRYLFGSRSWCCPLSEFDGIMHNIRTSLSESRHELVMVHKDRSKAILVHLASVISEDEKKQFSRFFRLQMIADFDLGSAETANVNQVAGISSYEPDTLAA